MAQARLIPPTDEVKGLVAAIPGVRFNQGVIVGQDGPDAHLGPEAAGAILVLHMTVADDAAAERFWRTTTAVKQTLPDAQGFIRLFSFFDGVSGYLVAFWRSPEHAKAFAAAPAHRAAMAALDSERFEYSHFVGLWSAHSLHDRNLYCERCDAVTAAPASNCRGCGNPLDDVFSRREPAQPQPA
jgi:heme-degrading monooxygenase HmoA